MRHKSGRIFYYLMITYLLLPLSFLAAENGEKVEIRGKVPTMILQHPILTSPGSGETQGYLDLTKDGEFIEQIILIYPGSLRTPEPGQSIVIAGKIQRVTLGGPAKTKGSYSGKVVHVESWKPDPKKP